ncbi:MAG: hypothetical protein K5910_00885 [Bacteroidales bacterium]|nr:hypothetical protein [Bacteroidales bacterium]
MLPLKADLFTLLFIGLFFAAWKAPARVREIGGVKVALVPVLYGLIVYFVSLVLRIIHKPRI